MKKILPLLVVNTLVIIGFGAVAISNDITDTAETEGKSAVSTIAFSSLVIEETDSDYVEMSIKDMSSYIMSPGQPMLPKVVESVELPFGVKNVKVEVIPKTVKEYKIEGEIRPAPVHVPLMADMDNMVVTSEKDIELYASEVFFPSTWYDYCVGCGLNACNERVTHVTIHVFPVRYAPALGKLVVAESAGVEITYDPPGINMFSENSEYDLVIIAPSKFTWRLHLQRLVRHKNNHGVNTILKTTQEIYRDYPGVDKPEQIKYFIKDAIETWGVKYVLLFGGLKSVIWARARDDANQGTTGWYVPVRYNNIFDNPEHPLVSGSIHDPGVISDLYYADIYREGGVFEDWDPNDDGFFAAWGRPGVANDTDIDLFPDVCVGRLACRNIFEVRAMVDKIIRYERDPADPSWFKKMVVVSGDGFLDQQDLDIQWNVNCLPDGEYTIYAKSINPENIFGPIDIINVTLDRSVESNISFNHDDHLKTDSYPFPPIAEITSPSEGNILGNTDVFYEPRGAYCNDFTGWANVEYVDGIMHIRGKSYDPKPYGNVTDIYVWIENEKGEVVFSDWRNDTEMYYEGEWVTGEKLLKGGGGALYYMPEDFKKIKLWTSNGKLTKSTGQLEVIETLSKGCGFVFFSGHGNPQVWADHLPGVPGNRGPSQVTGLLNLNLVQGPPYFPMNALSNRYKPPVLVVGGCHNSQFNVTALSTVLDGNNNMYTWTYGSLVPECWSWWFTRLPRRGAIAAIGNTGLGYGVLGKDCTVEGLDGGICIEFFRQYGEENQHILGEAYSQTITNYLNNFDMGNQDHVKTVHQWVLLGDPSLMIGGYT